MFGGTVEAKSAMNAAYFPYSSTKAVENDSGCIIIPLSPFFLLRELQHAEPRRRSRRLVPEGGLRPAEHVGEAHQTVRKRLSPGYREDAQVQEHGSR